MSGAESVTSRWQRADGQSLDWSDVFEMTRNALNQLHYLEHVRDTLRFSTTALQSIAITGWAISILVNPVIEQRFTVGTVGMLLLLVAICFCKARVTSILWWRVGTILYALALAWAFRLELNMMDAQAESLALPLTILMIVGFSGIVPLRRDYLVIAVVIWAVFLARRSPVFLSGIPPVIAAVLLVSVLLVGLCLNHAVIVNMRNTFALKERFRELADTDPLTGMPNRRALMAHLESLRTIAPGEESYFAMLDVDDFKSINDRYGHDVGDAVLMALASELGRLSHRAFSGRIGGEEFAIVMQGCSRESAFTLLQRLLEDVAALQVRGVRFGFSAGLVRLQPDVRLDQLLRRADAALYAAKQDGKGRVAWGED